MSVYDRIADSFIYSREIVNSLLVKPVQPEYKGQSFSDYLEQKRKGKEDSNGTKPTWGEYTGIPERPGPHPLRRDILDLLIKKVPEPLPPIVSGKFTAPRPVTLQPISAEGIRPVTLQDRLNTREGVPLDEFTELTGFTKDNLPEGLMIIPSEPETGKPVRVRSYAGHLEALEKLPSRPVRIGEILPTGGENWLESLNRVIVNTVNRPVANVAGVELSVPDILMAGTITYGGVMAAKTAWQTVVKVGLNKAIERVAAQNKFIITPVEKNSVINAMMKGFTSETAQGAVKFTPDRWQLTKTALNTLFRKTPKGYQATAQAQDVADKAATALVNQMVPQITKFTKFGGGMPGITRPVSAIQAAIEGRVPQTAQAVGAGVMRKLPNANQISDFRVGIDKVVREGNRTFVVDTEGIRKRVEVKSDAITPEFISNIQKLNTTQKEKMIESIKTTPYLSDEGRIERLTKLQIAPITPKEPWQMTRAEYVKMWEGKPQFVEKGMQPADVHEYLVKLSLSEGKPVLPEVLQDYPELAGKAPIKPEITRLKAFRGERPIQEGRLYATDAGDLGAGVYYTDYESTAKAYGVGGKVKVAELEFKNPLKLSSEEAVKLSDKYKTVTGNELERISGARQMRKDLIEKGYDGIIVEGYETPKGYHTIVDLRPIPPQATAELGEVAPKPTTAPVAGVTPPEAIKPTTIDLTGLPEGIVPKPELMKFPPIKPPTPPFPPTTTGGQPTPPIGDPVNKLTQLIRSAKPVRAETEILKHEELRKRAGMAAGILKGGEGREAFLKSKGALKGELPQAQFTPPEVSLTPDEITSLFNKIRDSELPYFQKLNTSEALEKVLLGQIPTRGDIALLEKAFGSELVKAILSKRSLGAKAWEAFLEAWNIPRTLLASIDFSASLRQGVVLAPGRPKSWGRAFKEELRAFAKEENALAVDRAIQTGKYAELRAEAGLYHAPLSGKVGAKLTQREESFASTCIQRFAGWWEKTNVINKILTAPLYPLAKGVQVSERIYITFLNKLRADTFDSTVDNWERTGFEATRKDYKELAKFINNATGRGSLGKLEESAPFLSGVLFSPRLQASRIRIAESLFTGTAKVRKESAKILIKFLAAGLTVLGLAKLAGADVDINPLSADFGKIQIGKTRLDIWGGFQQYARLIANLITGMRTSPTTGRTYEANRMEIIQNFVRSKLMPSVSFFYDLAEGKTYIGEDMELTPYQAYQRLTPMFIQDMMDAINEEGLVGGIVTLPGIFGVGIVTYDLPDWPELEEYYKLETTKERNAWRISNPEGEAKFFILGRFTTLKTEEAKQHVLRIMKEENIDPKDVRGYENVFGTIAPVEGTGQAPIETPVETTTSPVTQVPTPTPTTATTKENYTKWMQVRSSLKSADLKALNKVWFEGGSLTLAETASLQDVFAQHNFGQSNFNTWLKQTLRQIYENAISESQ